MFPNREPLFCVASYTGLGVFIYLMLGILVDGSSVLFLKVPTRLEACCTRIGDAGRIVL